MRLLLFILAGSLAACAQDADVLLHHSFDKDSQGWTAMGTSVALKSVDGSLAFTYDLSSKSFAAAILPAADVFTSMHRMRFRLKADHDTAVGVVLSEKKPGGGDYAAFVWARAGVWQQVELTPADFAANDGPTDPVDSNGKLDLDQVQSMAIIDVAQLFNSIPENGEFPMVVTKSTGTHTLLIDDFELLSASAKTNPSKANAMAIDAFTRATLSWITLGGMDLKLSSLPNPLSAPALEAAYESKEGQFLVLTRRLPTQDYSKAKRLVFDIASEREVTLAISMEVRKTGSSQGPRYITTIVPPPGKKPFHVDISLAEFEHDANSPADTSANLNPSRIKSLTLTDITAASGGEAGPNRIWIANLEMKP